MKDITVMFLSFKNKIILIVAGLCNILRKNTFLIQYFYKQGVPNFMGWGWYRK